MPTRPPQHHPAGYKPVPRVRTDKADQFYGTSAWRKVASAVIARDGGRCALCGKYGATTAHHRRERRDGGSDDPSNLEAVHGACHNRLHGRRGA